MKTLIDFFIGTGGTKSSKRLFLFILIILFCTYFFANLFGGRVLKDSLEENLFYLIVVMFVGDSSEPLMRKQATKPDPNKPAP